MTLPSLTRQRALQADRPHLRTVRRLAAQRFGQAALDASPTLLWTMRCLLGMQGQLPFRATVSRQASEWLWLARQPDEETTP